MNEWQVKAVLDEFLVGQVEAMQAFTFALGRVVDRDRLAEELRLQMIATPDHGTANPVRHTLLHAAWQAVRHPAPPEPR
jgi:hypothetical protein